MSKSSIPHWKATLLHRSPTVNGFDEFKALIQRPQVLNGIAGCEDRWESALLSLLTHGLHNDGSHLDHDNGFYQLTSDHYRTGVSKTQPSLTQEKIGNWHSRTLHTEHILHCIFDLCTVSRQVDRWIYHCIASPWCYVSKREHCALKRSKLTYTSTLKSLKSTMSLHAVVAQITQLFLSDYATPLANAFADTCTRHKWGNSTMAQTPTKGKARTEDPIMPLIPRPIAPTSAHFIFPGRPAGSLEWLLSSSDYVLSHAPSFDNDTIKWKPHQIGLVQGQRDVPAARVGGARVRGVHKGTSTAMTHTDDESSKSSQLSRTITVYSTSSSESDSQHPHSHTRYPPVMPISALPSKGIFSSTTSPTRTPPRFIAEPLYADVSAIIPFGDETEAMLENLGYPDNFHNICILICQNYLAKRWVTVLQQDTNISLDHADTIGQAMLKDRNFLHLRISLPSMAFPTSRSHNPRRFIARTRGPYIKVSKEVRQQLTEWRRTKRLDEDQEIQAVLNYMNSKATDLACKFKQPRRRYLERFTLGSVVHHRKRNKTSAWHAFMHFQGIRTNANKDMHERSNIADFVKETTEYHQLTAEQKTKLILDFDEVKKGARDRPPNITARSRATECARSFQYVKEEFEALKQRVGIEAIVVMVRGVSNFSMAPKAFFTSSAAEQFVWLYLHKDVAQLATDFESTILANGLVLNSATNHRERVTNAKAAIRTGLHLSLCEVTNNPSASMEFTKYEKLVSTYFVKLVGWNHPQWANPSDLKGGIESLENVVEAIRLRHCRFVVIDQEEVKERARRIKNGETLTPELEPPVPLEPPPSNTVAPPTHAHTPPPHATTADISPLSYPVPDNSQPDFTTPDDNAASAPSSLANLPHNVQPAPLHSDDNAEPARSSITDDMVDPELHALDQVLHSDTQTALETNPSQAHTITPMLTPLNDEVTPASTLGKRTAADVPLTETHRPKRSRKLTEKAQLELESRNETDHRQSKKRNAHTESNREDL
ncbi:hypothetical protein EDB19DRAFT_1919195 [Suillus lakei]|nr:hypothetical protein EDB19DRAFT_1919195 [Suillus lakei]